MTFSAQLKSLCGEWKAEDLAKELEVGLATVYSWLTEGSSSKLPSPQNLQKLLQFLKVEPEKELELWRAYAQAGKQPAQVAA